VFILRIDLKQDIVRSANKICLVQISVKCFLFAAQFFSTPS